MEYSEDYNNRFSERYSNITTLSTPQEQGFTAGNVDRTRQDSYTRFCQMLAKVRD